MPEHRSSCVDAQQQVFRCRLVISSHSAFSLLAAYVAIGITDFFNDIASYLGPLLSLGREHNIVDYTIFAVTPIGIITLRICAIHCCGSTALHSRTGVPFSLHACRKSATFLQVDGLPTVRALASHIKYEIIQRPPLYN
jgi:hypothetical protein